MTEACHICRSGRTIRQYAPVAVTDVEFPVGTARARLRRSWWTGKARIEWRGSAETVQSPWQVSTHFSLRRTKTWRLDIDGHAVEIIRLKPGRFFGAFRKCRYTVFVDNNPVRESEAY